MRDQAFAVLVSIGLLALTACGGGESHEHEAHGDHGEDAGHHHGGEDELPAESVTVWTNDTELFMEYDPLVVGEESAFAAHVTAIPGFKAVGEGAITVSVAVEGAGTLAGRSNRPSVPGIFRPTVRPDRAGGCTLRVLVEREGIRDEIDAGPCTVFPDRQAARAALGEASDDAGAITFLKEQQWKTEFATVAVEERQLQRSVQASAEIVPAAGMDARVIAPAPGRVDFGTAPPVLGKEVRKGDMLALFTPRLADGDRASLEADLHSARAEAEAARAERSRVERLFAEEAVSRRRVEEAKARATTAEARLGGAAGRLEQYDAGVSGSAAQGRGSFELRSPIDGTLVAVEVAAGEAVEAGKLLFRVIDLATVWLEARVFEPDIPRIEGARSGWFTVEGYAERFTFDEANARLIAVGRVIDAASRTVPVIFAIENPGERLRIGQFVKVHIASGGVVRAVAVPEAAVLEDGGKPVAYVQVEGEAFERRVLTTGIRDGGWIQVIDGLTPGERVVGTGAYEIKLAAASGIIPADGHAH